MSPLDGEGEEYVYADPMLIVRLREKLVEFLAEIPGSCGGGGTAGVRLEERGRVASPPGLEPRSVAVVDGGSNIISLNAGYLGIVASLGILIEEGRVARRVVGEPELVPPKPSKLGMYESVDQVKGVVDKLREAKVFETALEMLEMGPELLIVDGPLIPYGALAKMAVGSELEVRALERYRSAVLSLHREALGRNTSVVGFVKRPRSRFLSRILGGPGAFDHILLSPVLGEGEYYPAPPRKVPEAPEWFHDERVLEVVRRTRPRFTFLRLSPSHPPFRVDFGHLAHSYGDVLGYLYSTRTREGIPYPLMKVDEEVKITRRLLRELYEDALHSYIARHLEHGFSALIPVLPEYGGI